MFTSGGGKSSDFALIRYNLANSNDRESFCRAGAVVLATTSSGGVYERVLASLKKGVSEREQRKNRVGSLVGVLAFCDDRPCGIITAATKHPSVGGAVEFGMLHVRPEYHERNIAAASAIYAISAQLSETPMNDPNGIVQRLADGTADLVQTADLGEQGLVGPGLKVGTVKSFLMWAYPEAVFATPYYRDFNTHFDNSK